MEGTGTMPTDALTIASLRDSVGLKIAGEVDADTREQFMQALAQTVGSNGDTALDLGGVSFMDTHSVTAVVQCAKRLHEEGGRLIVRQPPDSLRRIFELLWESDRGLRLYVSGERGEP
jgi:anti-anti-sigma factor